MRKFREIILHKLLVEVLRSNYASDSDFRINNLYKFLLCLLYPLEYTFGQFLTEQRQKLLSLASCDSVVSSIENVLNMLFFNLSAQTLTTIRENGGRPPIRCNNSTDEDYFLYPQALNTAPAIYWSNTQDSDTFLYVEGTSIRAFDVSIPESFTTNANYSNFIGALNALMILPIKYKLIVREEP